MEGEAQACRLAIFGGGCHLRQGQDGDLVHSVLLYESATDRVIYSEQTHRDSLSRRLQRPAAATHFCYCSIHEGGQCVLGGEGWQRRQSKDWKEEKGAEPIP